MSFLRPEARAALSRWREAILGAIVTALGAWWFLTVPGLIHWAALGLAALGMVLTWTGVQRARFPDGRGGLGVVQVDERQIIYMAPVGGGFASLDSLSRVDIAPDRAGLPVWRFFAAEGVLQIPVNAEGTHALFEALTALPGINMEAAIRIARSRPDRPTVIWTRPGTTGTTGPAPPPLRIL